MASSRRDLIAESVWAHEPRDRGPRGRGRQRPDGERPGLNRDQIVATAIVLLDAEGVDGLSMRKLGTRLGSGATSLYWYVANKGELIDLALDEIFGEMAVPPVSPTDWRKAAVEYCYSFRDTLTRHPWALSVMGERPNVGPKVTTLSDATLGMLMSVGFSAKQSAYAASSLTSYALGNAVAEASWRSTQQKSGMTAAELSSSFAHYYDGVVEQYPSLGQWFKEVDTSQVDTMRDEAFDFGLMRQLDGLEKLLTSAL